VDFDGTDEILIIYSAFVKYLRKWEYSDAVHQLFIDSRMFMVLVGWRSFVIKRVSMIPIAECWQAAFV
jgi:hypothetical protein